MNYRVERLVAGLRRLNCHPLTPDEIDAIVRASQADIIDNPKRSAPHKGRKRLRGRAYLNFKRRHDAWKKRGDTIRFDRRTKPFLAFLGKSIERTNTDQVDALNYAMMCPTVMLSRDEILKLYPKGCDSTKTTARAHPYGIFNLELQRELQDEINRKVANFTPTITTTIRNCPTPIDNKKHAGNWQMPGGIPRR